MDEGSKAVKKSAQVDSTNPLESLQARIQASKHGMQEIASRLETMADCVLGSVPEQDSAEAVVRHYPHGRLGEIHEDMNALERQLSRIATVAGRLSQLSE